MSFVTVLVAACSVDTVVIERNTEVLIKNGLCYLLLRYINTWDYLLLLFERLAAYGSSKNQTRARLQCSVVNIIENNNCLHLSLKSSYKSVKVNYSFPALRSPKSYPKSDPHSNLPCNVLLDSFFFWTLSAFVLLTGWSLIHDLLLFLSNLVLLCMSLCLVNFVSALLRHAKQQLASSQLSPLVMVTIPSPASFPLIFLLKTSLLLSSPFLRY